MKERIPINESSKSGEFDVPEHVINELGNMAGNVSAARELIGKPVEVEQPAPQAIETEIETWAINSIHEALEAWHETISRRGEPHWAFNETPVPKDIDSLKMVSYNFERRLRYLCQAKQALTNYGEQTNTKTASGENIGDAMSIVLMPWDFFARETRSTKQDGSTPSLYYTLIELHGYNEFETEVTENLKSNDAAYILDEMEMTPDRYLDLRITREGSWGMMLMQNSIEPGLRVEGSESPSYVTLDDSRQLSIAGQSVGELGFFEEIAFSLQVDHFDYIANPDSFWLPANIFTDDEKPNPNASHRSKSAQVIRRIRGDNDRRQVRLTVGT
jgi:hypothetical protein